MKRQLKKQISDDSLENLKKSEELTLDTVKEISELRRNAFDDERDLAFYFCVVFDTRMERDNWLKEHNLKLTEDFFIKIKDFKI